MTLPPLTSSGAVLSPCDQHRYFLWRVWDEYKPPTIFIMLNPSTANAKDDDATIRKCMSYAHKWGAGGINILNLFSYRTKSPKVLVEAAKKGIAVIGPENDGTIRRLLEESPQAICGWGNLPTGLKPSQILTHLYVGGPKSAQLMCLGTNLDGSPKHPLYLRGDLQPVPFDLFRETGRK